MNNILIINPFGVGDCLFTLPMIDNIKAAYPQARLSYLANERTAQLLKASGNIDSVLVYDRDEYVAVYHRGLPCFVKKCLQMVQDIRRLRCDAVIDLSLNRAFGTACWAAGIPLRIGYDYKGRGTFLNHKIALKGFEGRHIVEYYLDLLKPLKVPVIQRRVVLKLGHDEEVWTNQWLKAHGLGGSVPFAVIVPGGGASWAARAGRKRWPAVKYAQLIDKMVADLKVAVILCGDSRENCLAKEIESLVASEVHSAVGETTILQMAALFKRSRVAVVNDGGPLHVAVASGARTVGIFGPVDPFVYGPYPSQGHAVVSKGLPCQPCYRRFFVSTCSHLSCLQDLTVEEVYRKVREIYEHSIH